MARASELYARGELSAKDLLMLSAMKFFAEGNPTTKEKKKASARSAEQEYIEDSDEDFRG